MPVLSIYLSARQTDLTTVNMISLFQRIDIGSETGIVLAELVSL